MRTKSLYTLSLLIGLCFQQIHAQVVCTIDNTATYGSAPAFANGAAYKNFGDALAKLNSATINAPVTFNVTAGQTFNETVSLKITKNGTLTNTITFKKFGSGINPVIVPVVGVGNSDVGFKLEAVSYITIDGIDIKDGPGYTVGVQAIEYGYQLVTSTSIANTNNTIQNCTVTLNNTNTNATYGVYQNSTSGTGPACSYNIYNNITVNSAYAGIYLLAKASLSDSNCVIKNCTIGAATPNSIGSLATTAIAYGIYGRYQNNVSIYNCEVRNVTSTNTTNTSEVNGIALLNGGGVSNIYSNKIHDISNKGTGTTVNGTNGIQVVMSASADVNIYNNFIYGLYTGDAVSPSGVASAIKLGGITIGSGSLGSANVYFNSIYLQNSTTNYLVPVACINASSQVSNTLNLANNILKNAYVGSPNGYCVFLNNTTVNAYTALATCDYNNYDIVTSSSKFTGRVIGANQITLANWQAATGKEANGKQFTTSFTSIVAATEDLHLNIASANSSYYGMQITSPSITTDIDIDTRSTTNPYIGADEKIFVTASTWAGTTQDWNTPTNWTPTGVPTSTSNVIIPNIAVTPFINASNYSVQNLTIDSAAIVSIDTAYQLNISGAFYNRGTVTGGGKLVLNGAALQTITGIGSMNNLVLNNSNNVTISTGASNVQSITGVLTLTNGTLNTNGNLVLKSTTSQTAQVATITSGSINGDVTTERYIPAGKRSFRFLTSPVTSVTSIHVNWQEGATSSTNNPVPNYGTHITGSIVDQQNGFDSTITGNASLFLLNNATQAWSAINNTDVNTLKAGNAYRLFVRGDRAISLATQPLTNTATTLRSKGTLITGNVVLGDVASTPSGMPVLASASSNFSFVGNPYASSINWTTIAKIGLTGYYYMWDPTLATRGAYVSVFTDGTKSNLSSNATVNIQSGQSFFIENTPSASARQLSIAETDKSSINSNAVFRNASTAKIDIRLFLSANIAGVPQDGTAIFFEAGANNGVDVMDASKLDNLDENIAIDKTTKQLSIEERAMPTINDTILLKMWQMAVSAYTLRFDAANFVNASYNAFLQDSYLNTETPISLSASTDYAFTTTTDPTSVAANRFRIVFKSSLPVTITAIKAYQKDNGIQVDWNVATEVNMDRYEIEKSTDARTFNKQASIKSSNRSKYVWYDAMPIMGANYYRIKTIDKSGAVDYSAIVNVKIGKAKNVFAVVGNPIVNNTLVLQMENVEKGNYSVSILNMMGQQVANQIIQHAGGSATQAIRLKTLPKGQYQVSILGNGIQVAKQFTIQD